MGKMWFYVILLAFSMLATALNARAREKRMEARFATKARKKTAKKRRSTHHRKSSK
jgi:hypothetical protein